MVRKTVLKENCTSEVARKPPKSAVKRRICDPQADFINIAKKALVVRPTRFWVAIGES
jgi:hypothetical protein